MGVVVRMESGCASDVARKQAGRTAEIVPRPSDGGGNVHRTAQRGTREFAHLTGTFVQKTSRINVAHLTGTFVQKSGGSG